MKLWHKLLIVLAVTSGSTLGVTNLLNQPSEDLVFGATKAPATQGGTNLDAYRKGDLLYSPASISLASPGANSLARLASGSAGQCLIMSGGIPAWSSSCGGGSSNFTGLDFGVIGGTQVKITSQSFDAGMFDLSNTASEGFVRLDWTNGPASRSTANTWSALNTFSAGASVSGSLELAGTASISGAVVIGSGLTGTAKGLVVNNGTSTGNIFEAQDNGSAIFTIADGGKVSAIGTAPGVSTPQYSFIGDTDTGLMRTGADALHLQAGGQYTGLKVGASSFTLGWSAATVSTGNGTGDVTFSGSGYASGLAVTGGFKINPNANYGYITNVALFNSNPTNFTNYSIAGTYDNFATHRFGVMNMTVNAGQALTITDNATVKIDGAPTVSGAGIAQTNAHALWVVDGQSTFAENVVIGASLSGTTKALVVDNDSSTGNIFEARDGGAAVFTVFDGGRASLSGAFEVGGYASSSLRYGSGLTSCTGSNALQWDAGLFSCAAVSGGSSFNGIGFGTIGATDVNVASIQFDAGMFNLSNTASLGFVRLDWTNGPASRSTANTWALLQTFSKGASMSEALEVATYASASYYRSSLGSAAAPAYGWRSATGLSGFHFDNASGGSINIDVNGAAYFQVTNGGYLQGTSAGGGALRLSGDVTQPVHTFNADLDTGLYTPGANVLGFSANALRIGSASNSGWEFGGNASISGVVFQNALGSSSFNGTIVGPSAGVLSIGTIANYLKNVVANVGRFLVTLVVPNSSNPTVSEAGSVAVNTASGSFEYRTSTQTKVLGPCTRRPSYVLKGSDLSAKNQWSILLADDPYSLRWVSVTASGTNSLSWNLRTGSATVPATNVFTLDKQASGSAIVKYSTFATASISDGFKLDVVVTSTSATLDSVIISTCVDADTTE